MDDDIRALYPNINAAEGIAFVTPRYCYDFFGAA